MPISRKRNRKTNATKEQNNHKDSIQILDLGEMSMQEFFNGNHIDMELELRFYAMSIYEEVSEGNSVEDIVNGSWESEFLVKYLVECEKRIEYLFSDFDVYELTYWFRRVPPRNFFKNGLDSSVILRHEITTNAIFKYGKYDNYCDDDRSEALPGGGLHPTSVINAYLKNEKISLDIIKCLKSVYRAIVLSHLFLTVTQEYRVLNKGGKMVAINNFYSYKIEDDYKLRHLLNIYDTREATSLLAGSGVDTDPLKIERDDVNSIKLLGCVVNVDNKKDLPAGLYSKLGVNLKKYNVANLKKHLNYFPAVLHAEEVVNYLKYYNSDIIKNYGFSVEDFAVFNATVSLSFILYVKKFPSIISVLRRGYVTAADIDSYKKDFSEKARVIYKKYFDKEQDLPIDKLFDLFTIDQCKASQISLWTRGPRAYFYKVGDDFYLLDYLAMLDVIRYFGLHFSKLEGKAANYRSDRFEKRVKMSIEEKGLPTWICSREIKAGRFLKKEIDCSFIYGEFLFLLEAKSINVSFGFDKGDLQALNYRIREFEKAIEQVEEKADFILKHYRVLNIPLPKNVKYIVPLVISTWYEYIWYYNEYFFLDKEFKKPRIINIQDIDSLKLLDFDYLKSLSYIRVL